MPAGRWEMEGSQPGGRVGRSVNAELWEQSIEAEECRGDEVGRW